MAQTRQKLGQGVAGWVAEQRQPLLLDGDLTDDERFENLFEIEDDEITSSISVPLDLRHELLGVLNVSLTERASREALTEYDLRMLTVFAQHAAAAIENARLRLAAAMTDVPTAPEVQ